MANITTTFTVRATDITETDLQRAQAAHDGAGKALRALLDEAGKLPSALARATQEANGQDLVNLRARSMELEGLTVAAQIKEMRARLELLNAQIVGWDARERELNEMIENGRAQYQEGMRHLESVQGALNYVQMDLAEVVFPRQNARIEQMSVRAELSRLLAQAGA
jgi:hypothetical protein